MTLRVAWLGRRFRFAIAVTLDSPILGAFAAVLAAAVFVLTRPRAAAGRWLMRGGAVAAAVAIAGANVRCDRPLNIAVMVDVSPSTRGAAFRNERSVRTRLTPLLAGRPYTVHYFADGEQPTADEPACETTRLPVPAEADAVVLMSDGRFDLPGVSPPVFALVDPALDRPGDAAVREIVPAGYEVVAHVVTPGGRELGVAVGAVVTSLGRPAAGPGVVLAPARLGGNDVDRIGFNAGDLWPENDALRTGRPASPARRIAIDLALPGFENRTGQTPSDGQTFSDASLIVMPTGIDGGVAGDTLTLSCVDAVLAAVRDDGTTLVLVGPPAELSPALRRVSPLKPTPPAGPQAWTILLDASGSMGRAGVGGGSRWPAAIAAAGAAVDRLPENARVTVSTFAADVRDVAEGSPAEVGRALRDRSIAVPGGPTGLRGALAAVADRAAGASRVLLLSDGDADLGDVAALAANLKSTGVRLDAVVAAPSAALRDLCTATGGRATVTADAGQWEAALGGLAAVDTPPHVAVERWDGTGALAGREWWTTRRWPAHAADGAEVLAGDVRSPVAAEWNIGLGQVVTMAADLASQHGLTNAEALTDIARRLERQSADPRFAAEFDEHADTVRLTAVGPDGPMNGLSPRVVLGESSSAFEAVGPGRYIAPLPRSRMSGMARVVVDGRTVARAMRAGRYAREFDAIGNDRDALTALTRRSGGAVVEAGDHRAITLPKKFVERPLGTPMSAIAMLLWIAGLLAFRSRPKP